MEISYRIIDASNVISFHSNRTLSLSLFRSLFLSLYLSISLSLSLSFSLLKKVILESIFQCNNNKQTKISKKFFTKKDARCTCLTTKQTKINFGRKKTFFFHPKLDVHGKITARSWTMILTPLNSKT